MSFLEFLRAMGKPRYAELLLELTEPEPLPAAIHADLTDLLRTYYFTGGMPEAVSHHAEAGDARITRQIQNEILDSYVLDAPPGDNRVHVEVGVFLESRFKDRERGTPGWSLSVLAEHCFDIEDATVAGTAVDHYFDKGFKIVQRIDPKLPHNAGRQGVVSAVMISRGGEVTLPPVGEELVLLIRGTVDVSELEGAAARTSPCVVRPVDTAVQPGLQGRGRPVETNVAGDEDRLEVFGAAISFVRRAPGDVDGDGDANSTDAILIMKFLFAGDGTAPDSLPGADVDGDGAVSVVDSILLMSCLTGAGSGHGLNPSRHGDPTVRLCIRDA